MLEKSRQGLSRSKLVAAPCVARITRSAPSGRIGASGDAAIESLLSLLEENSLGRRSRNGIERITTTDQAALNGRMTPPEIVMDNTTRPARNSRLIAPTSPS